jgi:hypothetical protein
VPAQGKPGEPHEGNYSGDGEQEFHWWKGLGG